MITVGAGAHVLRLTESKCGQWSGRWTSVRDCRSCLCGRFTSTLSLERSTSVVAVRRYLFDVMILQTGPTITVTHILKAATQDRTLWPSFVPHSAVRTRVLHRKKEDWSASMVSDTCCLFKAGIGDCSLSVVTDL